MKAAPAVEGTIAVGIEYPFESLGSPVSPPESDVVVVSRGIEVVDPVWVPVAVELLPDAVPVVVVAPLFEFEELPVDAAAVDVALSAVERFGALVICAEPNESNSVMTTRTVESPVVLEAGASLMLTNRL